SSHAEQIRPVSLCLLHCGVEPPFTDCLMIARYQNFRHLPSPELGWARVMRMFHKLHFHAWIRKRIPEYGFFFTDDTGNIPCYCINDHCRCDFAARNDKIADRNLSICQMFD